MHNCNTDHITRRVLSGRYKYGHCTICPRGLKLARGFWTLYMTTETVSHRVLMEILRRRCGRLLMLFQKYREYPNNYPTPWCGRQHVYVVMIRLVQIKQHARQAELWNITRQSPCTSSTQCAPPEINQATEVSIEQDWRRGSWELRQEMTKIRRWARGVEDTVRMRTINQSSRFWAGR